MDVTGQDRREREKMESVSMNAYLKSFLKFGLPSLIFIVFLFVLLDGVRAAIPGLIVGVILCVLIIAIAGFLTSNFTSSPVADLGKEIKKIRWGQLGASLLIPVLLFGGAVISFEAKRVVLGYTITLPVTLAYIYIFITVLEIKGNVENTWKMRLLHTIVFIFSYSLLFVFTVFWLADFDGDIIREILQIH
jgi:hypothetical protein